MPKLVTIYGGSGFLGRYIARRMAKLGWRVRVAVRRPNEAMFVKPYGTVGQVVPVFCNIRDDESVRAAMSGADAVVNCVGTFDRSGRNNFDAVQHEGAARIALISKELGVAHVVSISALGSNAEGDSEYAQSKGEGEAAVLEARPDAMILRPGVMFGTEDGFFNRFAAMTRLGPILPLVGGASKFQPVYVDDVAEAAVLGATGKAKGGIYELGGPEVKTLRDWIGQMLEEIRARRLVINLPFWVGSVMATLLDFGSALTLGLFPNTVLTRDQVKQLHHDNVASGEYPGLEDLGIKPTPADAVIEDYLWPYRPSGQYSEIKASARNLKV